MELNLKAVYAHYQKLCSAKMPEKAVSRYMSGAGKQYTGSLCSDGFAAQELATAYIEWLTLDKDLQVLLHKNTLLSDVYYFMTVARGVADKQIMVKEIKTVFNPTGTIVGDIRSHANGVEAVHQEVKHPSLEAALMHLAPVDIDEVVELLSYEDYIKYLPFKVNKATDYLDLKRVIHLKLLAAPYWHAMNDVRVEQKRIADIEAIESKLDADYLESIANGLVVPEYHEGLTRREVEVYEIEMDGLLVVPENLKEFRTSKVMAKVFEQTRKMNALRAEAKVKREAKAKAKSYKDNITAMEGLTLPVRNYYVKSKLLTQLKEAKAVNPLTVSAFWLTQVMSNIQVTELNQELIRVTGSIENAIAALEHTDFATDPLLNLSNETIEHVIRYEDFTLLTTPTQKYNQEFKVGYEFITDTVLVSNEDTLKELVRKYKELVLLSGNGDVQVKFENKDKYKVITSKDAKDALPKVLELIEEYKLVEFGSEVKQEVAPASFVDRADNWL